MVDDHELRHAFDEDTVGDCNVKTMCGLPTIVVAYVVSTSSEITCVECLAALESEIAVSAEGYVLG